ncbi:MAG: IS110 family transposase [Longispora sp.]|nr:IS110 family transposase [Longispora sp. (in: high G+C Gram-positive bacteria)]
MLSDTVDAVIGVDTHRDTHSASLVNAVGGELATITVATNTEGYQQLLVWSHRYAPGTQIVWALEGSRSHGAGLLRFLRAENQNIVEANRPKRARGQAGKSDPLDARRTARETLGNTRHAVPRADGPREAARILLSTREGAVQARTAAINQLKALICCAPDELRARLRNKTNPVLIAACLQLRPNATTDIEHHARLTALQRLARRIRDLANEITAAEKELTALARTYVAKLLEQTGIGLITAIQAWISWSEPGRFRNEAAFASLAGASPIPASSGLTTRHRLNRYGDRDLNQALHHITITRERCHPPTRDYVARRTAEGKTRKEIRRCLKRYLARQIFKILENNPPTQLDTT